MKKMHFATFGIVLLFLGIFFNFFSIVINIPRRLFFDTSYTYNLNVAFLWYSGIPIVIGILFIFIDFILNIGRIRKNKIIMDKPLENKLITVVLTAYNDYKSIGLSVEDFLSHNLVKRVIVISNNSNDKTIDIAKQAGAIVFNEEKQGYGRCVYRAFQEGIKFNDTSLIALCEGDMTFRANDIDKFLSYISHADIVVGSRIVEQLQGNNTQISTFIHYGNLFVGKLLESKHLGLISLTDVGTTYKLCRNEVLEELLPKLDPSVNLEFNPYFLDKALDLGKKIVECPITFHKRIGESKGGNVNNIIAFKLGLKMIYGILFDWYGLEKKL